TIRPNAAPTPAAAPAPLALIDRYHNDGDPQETTVRIENETAPFKVATDVVVVGSVWAPNLKPTRQTDATFEVGTVKKTVRVIGDRTCEHRTGQSPRVSDPEPFVEMPCQYDRAYGGVDETSSPGMVFMYPRNPRGTGFVLQNAAEKVNGLRLPNFEDPTDLLTPDRLVLGDPMRWSGMPLPQGFGWFPKIAYPRSEEHTSE